jgi:hypothetical protein
MLDRKTGSKLREDFEETAIIFAEASKLRHVQTRGSLSGNVITLTVKLMVDDDVKGEYAITQDLVDRGLAKPGTILYAKDSRGDNNWYEVRVLQSRRSKYLFEWVGFEEAYGKFITRFTALQVKEPK